MNSIIEFKVSKNSIKFAKKYLKEIGKDWNKLTELQQDFLCLIISEEICRTITVTYQQRYIE